ncbi:MAG: UbiD family decarboxylase [Deltaproteobacteria bacterium]|nr:UbiD family decarboxylase [Deltaproteobacteria bacterium]
MPFKDLREFIHNLRQMGELKVIEGASCDLEIGAVTEIAARGEKCPALLFDSIKGFPKGHRILTNALSNRVRERHVFGVAQDLSERDAVKYWKERLKGCKPVAPKEVKAAPVKENILLGDEVDLGKIPWPKWHEQDGGPYMCGTFVITRDPESKDCHAASFPFTWVNHNTVAPHAGLEMDGIWKKYWDGGRPCPVAISLGQDPVLFVAAGMDLRRPISGYAFAGWLRNEPVEVTKGECTDLLIPATSEVVLEGDLLPPAQGQESEGPFGEASGYYLEGKRSMPRLKVKGMLFRNDPVILGNPPFLEANCGVLSSKAAFIWKELEGLGIPNIVAVNHYAWGLTIISIKQPYPGHVKRVSHAALGSSAGSSMRFVIIVDEDIDPYSLGKVFWAVATRYEPAQALDIVRRISGDGLDPYRVKEKKDIGNYTSSTAIIDACRPYHWMDKFPRTTDISEDLLSKTAEKWSRVLRQHG